MSPNPDQPAANAGDATLHILKRGVAAVIELHITRKNMLIYPASHEQVRHSLKRAHERLAHAMELMDPLKFSVAPEELLIGTHPLNAKLSAVKETVGILKRYGVVSLSFCQPLLIDHLSRFLELLTTDLDKIRTQGGIAAELVRQQIEGISIELMDYSKLRVTEEPEIHRTRVSPKPAHSLWQHFVIRSLDSKAGFDQVAPAACNGQYMANLLNSRQVDAQKLLPFFQQGIAEMVAPGTGPDRQAAAVPEDLASFIQFIRLLGPELQQSFISTAFEHFAQHPIGETAARFIGALDPEQIYRTLVLAKSKGKQISPSLVAFLKKMEHLTHHEPCASVPDEAALASLLEREDYETYVDTGYDRLLHKLGEPDSTSEPPDRMADLRRDLSDSLEESQINGRVGRALMSLMAVSESTEEYRDWARQLTFLLDDMVVNEEFMALAAIFDFMVNEQNRQTDPDRQKITGLVLNRFEETHFIAKAVKALDRALDDTKAETLTFLVRLGEPVVVELLDRLSADHNLDTRTAAYAILQRTVPQVIAEALERLSDPRPAYVCFMLQVIRRFGANQNIDGIKTLLEHENPDVRMEALATLLSHNNAWGILRLRELINESWSPATQRAMEMAGHYSVREVVPLLLAMVERKGPLGADLDRRIMALNALGRIGDPRVLSRLTRLARRRGLVAKKHLRQLKLVLFESLEGYPFNDTKELLHFGLKHKDEAIQSVCRQIMRQQHQQHADIRSEEPSP